LRGIVSLADVVRRGEIKMTQAHERLKKVSGPTQEPSKPRARSSKAA
jgi:hypothetical protein